MQPNSNSRRIPLIGAGIAWWLLVLLASLTVTAVGQQPAGAKKVALKQPVSAKAVAADTQALNVAPEPPEYLVGEGDLLTVNVWREAEISQTLAVRPDGKISFPFLGEVRVSGLSPRQIQELLTQKLKVVLTNPQVTVSVAEVRSKMVYITGAVGKPGAYSAVAPMTVLQLIARAGGLAEFAKQKDIYILRANNPRERQRFNYKEVVKGNNISQNIVLQPGDTVVVR